MPMKPAKRKLPAGWMGKESRRWLKAQAHAHTRIIEVGSWYGRSTKIIAHHTEGTVWAVDHWQGTPHDPEQHALYAAEMAERDPFRVFRKNLKLEIITRKVVPVRMASVDAAAWLGETHGVAFDWVFIDADHSYEGCAGDINAYLPLLVPGGMMSGHDYHWPGVKRAVDEAFGDRVTLGPRSIWSLHV